MNVDERNDLELRAAELLPLLTAAQAWAVLALYRIGSTPTAGRWTCYGGARAVLADELLRLRAVRRVVDDPAPRYQLTDLGVLLGQLLDASTGAADAA